ncbi:Mu-like prophage FluMu protein gp29 [Enterobacter roggenkampii]|uniref:Mu-like prophage FluMu protein gp29 n=2 Tax=Enterobacter roggenkampii TaxID=1812935 RepID=A0ABD7KRP2_9ENTR|nr:Mu-like prophage FluMu protein gp29 [Enterobacter roggenkampii]
MEDITLNAAEAIGHGFSAQEIEKWELDGNLWLPVKIKLRPHRWFCTTPEAGDEVRLNTGTLGGEELWPFGWLVHTHNAKSGYIAQSGLYRVLVWPYLFKNYSVRDLAEFLEIYGLPPRIGSYMPGASQDEQDKLMEALVSIGHNASGIIPDNTKIEFKDAAEGQSDPFMAMINWCERTASKVILGGTLTSQADGKSSTHALGNVHNEVRHDLLTADARQLEGFYRGFIRMLLAINGYNVSPRRQPRLVFDTRELESIETFANGVSALVRAGMDTIPTSWIHKKVGIPVPKENEAVLTPPATPSPVGLSTTPVFRHFAALSTTGEVVDPAQDALDSATSPGESIAVAMDKLIAPLVSALREGQSPDEALDIIAASYPQLDDTQLQQLIKQALFVSEVWGRLNAES